MKQLSVKDIHEPSGKLEIFLFNVGQGDHIMLKFPTGEYGIIDFYYESGKNSEIPEPPCLSYFRELKDKLSPSEFRKITISFFCISHTDKDHIKGVTETLKKFDEKGVFIKDIWLGGAISEIQINSFLKEKVPALFKEEFDAIEQLKYSKTLELFKDNINNYSASFEKWKQGKFKSERHSNDERGTGEYLVEMRPLPEPSNDCEAFNVGPRTIQIEDYFKKVDLDLVKRIYKIKDRSNSVDKNLMSHILRLRFGEVNVLFGGDTHKKIWEECLDYYDKNKFAKSFGNYDSHFIKVSHHGSKNSSSPVLWEKILPKEGKIYLGISAGQHSGYKHPHSETLKAIRECRDNCNILSTNICHDCLRKDGFETEYHYWYDEFIDKQKNYNKEKSNSSDDKINARIAQNTVPEGIEKTQKSDMGLFAYIFEVPDKLGEEIKVRVALTKVSKSYACLFKEHKEKIRDCCE